MRQRIVVLTTLGLLLCGRVSAAALGVGSPAPKMEVKEYLKGQPVESFEKGKIYVVEFWATWCPPCRTTIPHLTEMQKKYKDVVFIGVSVFERNWDAVKPFVQEMGKQMDYRVAMDDREGKMSKNWMIAAAQESIPTAFIVNGEGKIAWIGHPMQMESTLKMLVSGNSSPPPPKSTPEPKTPDATASTTEKQLPKKADSKPKVESATAAESPPLAPEPKSNLPWIVAIIFFVGAGFACIVFAILNRNPQSRDDDDDDDDERPRKKRKYS
jgi:thiol-disulfide isomerase/thioredoxin